MSKIICHITSAHPANDIRIFHKECVSLANAGYAVHLVAKGALPVDNQAVIHHVLPEYRKNNRILRMVLRSFKAYQLAKATKASIFHFHDPELLPYGLLLKWQGYTVFYDAHEDLPRDVLIKDWLPSYLRKTIAFMVEKIENFIAKRMDTVVAATTHIADRFRKIQVKVITVHNFPKKDELCLPAGSTNPDKLAFCYVGLISKPRGILEMIQAMEALPVKLILAGAFVDRQTEHTVKNMPGWAQVDYRGVVSRQEVAHIYAESLAGLCLLHPTATYVESMPIKLFEYMSAGLPVVASNFPIWMRIIEETSCGVSIDPTNVVEIREVLAKLLSNPEDMRNMGLNGRKAILNFYNWEQEIGKLHAIYSALSN